PWADVDGYELLAEALAAGVRLTPRSQTGFTNRLVERVESHPSPRHRANLITALVGMLAGHAARSHLRPIMKLWLTPPRPAPPPALPSASAGRPAPAAARRPGRRHGTVLA